MKILNSKPRQDNSVILFQKGFCQQTDKNQSFIELEGKKGENQEKKTSNFFLLMRFYTGRRNVTNKSCLFYAKFFEFEVNT